MCSGLFWFRYAIDIVWEVTVIYCQYTAGLSDITWYSWQNPIAVIHRCVWNWSKYVWNYKTEDQWQKCCLLYMMRVTMLNSQFQNRLQTVSYCLWYSSTLLTKLYLFYLTLLKYIYKLKIRESQKKIKRLLQEFSADV